MDKSFDFTALLRKHAKYKSKPTQFESVAAGVKKRMEDKMKNRKNKKLTLFDNIRNLTESRCPSPQPPIVPETLSKLERRKQQLEKWKEEKIRKKKEEAKQKKKPFVAGVTHNPMTYVPPPPPKAVPSTSGRVTRSQTRRARETKEPPSFAPKNAVFRPPKLQSTIPTLQPFKPKKNTELITFAPITGSKTYVKKSIERPRKAKGQIKISTVKTMFCHSLSSDNEAATSTGSFSSTAQTSTENEVILQNSLQSSSSDELEKSSVANETSESRKKDKPKSRKSSTPKQSRLSDDVELITFTPMKPVPKSESSSEEKLRSPKEAVTPQQTEDLYKKISPCVTVSRGKDKARKEMKEKLKEGLLDEDASDMDSVVYFKRQLAAEMARLGGLCDAWDKIAQQNALPDFVQELYLAAVGQARLLMSKKLQQFGALVERCAGAARADAACVDAPVTPADLAGFWDMVFMQVVNIDIRFKKLEELRARNWVEETPLAKPKVVKPTVKQTVKPAVKQAKPRPGNSRLKEMIAAARAAKQQPREQPAEKTFEAGFFSVRSPAKEHPPAADSPRATPRNKQSLLKAVLSSEAKKSANKASFAMLRASAFSRNVECDGVSPLPQTPVQPVNIAATPGRSILKQKQDTTDKPSRPLKAVLFSEDDVQSDDCIEAHLTKKAVEEANEDILDKEASESDLHEAKTDKQAKLDSGLSSMEAEEDLKENKTPKTKSTRTRKSISKETIEDRSPVMTRNRRKSGQTPQTEKTKKTTRGKKVLEEPNVNVSNANTPRRSTRVRKSVV